MKKDISAADRIEELEEAIREILDFYKGEWAAVGNHPASRYRREVEFYQDLLPPVDD